MKTKLFTLLLAVAAGVGTMFASTKIGDLYYNLDATNQTAEVTYKSYTNYEYNEGWGITTANIPASVEYNSVTYSVTSIGECAFRDCTGLISVTIGNRVTSIGNWAFAGCTGLTSVTIPNSVTSIGELAFCYCTGLTSVTIPNSVTSIGDDAFSVCTGLTSINVASDNPNYCSVNGVLFNKNRTTLISYPGGKQGAYTIPNSVTSIGNYAFFRCSSLTSIEIPNSVTSIGGYAFYNCTGLTSIEIPNSVTSIGSSAFYKCSSLTSVTIGNSVTYIGDEAFRGCSGLTSVTCLATIPPTFVGYYAFVDDCPIYVPCNAVNAYKTASKWKVYADRIYCPSDLPKITVRLDPSSCSSWTTVRLWAWTDAGDVFDSWPGQIVSKDGDGWYAYTFSSSITSVSIIWTNGTDQTVDITGVTSSTCYKLNSQTGTTIKVSVVDCPVSGKYKIGDLYYNLDATNQTAEVTYKSYNNKIFEYNEGWGITTANIPASVEYNSVTYSVTSIGDRAFQNCTGLTSVTIPYSVTSIGNSAFYGCSGLAKVNITDIAAWCNIAFGSNPLYYAKHLYVDDVEVTNLVIPEGVTSIGNWAFYGCRGLTSVTIPNSVTSIGIGAFCDCTGLTSVTIPNSVTGIGDRAFQNCTGLTSVTIGNSVTSIGENAFGWCSGLTSVTIGNSVTSIGDEAFRGCNSLTSVIWNAENFADFASNNTPFYDLRSQITSFTFGNEVEHIPANLCNGMSNLTSVTIPNSVTSIGGVAFYGCSGLASVTIGNSVTSIGGSAFYLCSGLTSITIPNSVTSIGNSVFYDCTGLTSVTIGNSVTSIGENAFSGCTGLTSVTIGNSVTSIGENAFGWCSGLTSVTIGNSVTSIGDEAFRGCNSLTSVIWNAENFADFASNNTPFYDLRSQITSFTFGNKVEHIPANLCYGMSNLTSVTIEAEIPPTLGSSAFGATNYYPIYVPCSTLDAYKTAWSNYASRIQYAPLPDKITTHAENGNVDIASLGNYTTCDEQPYYYSLTVIPNYGYHFTQWSDGNTDNPRTFVLTQDTTFTAEFAKNTYTITAKSSNPQWGTTAGDNSALYLDEVEISATANYGYHFVKWNDNNTENPRTISVTKDATYTATFAKNTYSITKITNSIQGSISGVAQAEYLDNVTLTASPNYGYHFTQWSDGNTDNPRTFVLTRDTTFTAEFAVDKSGTCGKNNLLQWTFADDGTLTISGKGELTENYTFGVEAPTQMQQLVIGNEVTSIGERAFYEKTTLQKLIIGSNVTSIGKYAFASINNRQLTSLVMPAELLTIGDYAFSGNTYLESIDFNAKLQSIGAYAFKDCYRVSEMTCLATVTPNVGTDALASINSYASLCVPAECLRKYQVDPNWGRFDLCELGTTSTVTENRTVTVEPTDNTAIFTWPTENNAASYSLQITKDGVVFCTLVFNSNGQLTGIAFAPGRNGASHAPAATMSVAGMSFTVTGLNVASKYAYRLAVADDASEELVAYSGEFATTGYNGEVNPGGNPEGIEDVFTDEHKASKILHNGQIFILRGEKVYTVTGEEVK